MSIFWRGRVTGILGRIAVRGDKTEQSGNASGLIGNGNPGVSIAYYGEKNRREEKWEYMRENPVRAGLVSHWSDWPYRIGFEL